MTWFEALSASMLCAKLLAVGHHLDQILVQCTHDIVSQGTVYVGCCKLNASVLQNCNVVPKPVWVRIFDHQHIHDALILPQTCPSQFARRASYTRNSGWVSALHIDLSTTGRIKTNPQEGYLPSNAMCALSHPLVLGLQFARTIPMWCYCCLHVLTIQP